MNNVNNTSFDLTRGMESAPNETSLSFLDSLHALTMDQSPCSPDEAFQPRSPTPVDRSTYNQPSLSMCEEELINEDVTEQSNGRAGDSIHSKDILTFSKSKLASPERKAIHNAIERARRENLNERFQQLARALPTMANVKRPSKNAIVNKTLEWICESQMREHHLMRENAYLRAQIKEIREHTYLRSIITDPSFPLQSPSADVSQQFRMNSLPVQQVSPDGPNSLGQPYHLQDPCPPSYSHD